MPFTQQLPVWLKTGTQPPDIILNTDGWKPGDKPPADWLNWFFNNMYLVTKELQEESINVDQKGAVGGVATLGEDGKVPATQLNISAPPDASTTVKGITMLEDSTTSTSTTKAATPKSVKAVNDSLVSHKADKAPHTNIPSCSVTHSVNQSAGDGLITTIAFNTEIFDNDMMHDNVTNNTRITCKTAGKYSVTGCVTLSGELDGGIIHIGIRKNSSWYTVDKRNMLPSGLSESLTISAIVHLDVNDYIELAVLQTKLGGGTSMDVTTGSYAPRLTVIRVGD